MKLMNDHLPFLKDSIPLLCDPLMQFEPLGLADIQEAALLDRVDTKYVFGSMTAKTIK